MKSYIRSFIIVICLLSALVLDNLLLENDTSNEVSASESTQTN